MAKEGKLYFYLRPGSPNHTEEWVLSLGRAAFSFAQLEGCAIWLLDRIGTARERKMIREKQSFAMRNELASLLVRYKGLDEPLVGEWVSLLGSLTVAAEMRNKIFHNPLNVPTLQDIGANDGIVLLKKGNSVVIGLGDIQEYNNDLDTLNASMRSLLERTPPLT